MVVSVSTGNIKEVWVARLATVVHGMDEDEGSVLFKLRHLQSGLTARVLGLAARAL